MENRKPIKKYFAGRHFLIMQYPKFSKPIPAIKPLEIKAGIARLFARKKTNKKLADRMLGTCNFTDSFTFNLFTTKGEDGAHYQLN